MFSFLVLMFCLGLDVKDSVATPSITRCAEIPPSVYRCLKTPSFAITEVSPKSCQSHDSECDRVKCFFSQSAWTHNGVVDKPAMIAYFTQFAQDKIEWSDAATYVTEQCLNKQLLPQGVHTDCPEYDIMHCIQTAFLRKSKSSQWSSSPECARAQVFARSCPACPTACFAPTIPAGSCTACLDWPTQ